MARHLARLQLRHTHASSTSAVHVFLRNELREVSRGAATGVSLKFEAQSRSYSSWMTTSHIARVIIAPNRSRHGLQDKFTQILILRDFIQPLLHVRGINFDAAHL